jgi:large subunit ribosomal protein L13
MLLTLTNTTHAVNESEVERKWFVVDATDQPLGRIASRIASVLRGKHTPQYTKNADTGDYVVVINAEKVKLTGNKLDQKNFNKHSGIPGGFRAEPYRSVMARKPELALEKAVKGMLPKTPLGRHMHDKLKVYAGSAHPHAAQKPVAFPY